MTFILWPKPPKPSAFVYANTRRRNVISCLYAYDRVSPGANFATSKMDAETINWKA